MSKVSLNSWYEIDEREYVMYTLRGYELDVAESRVIWNLDNKLHREDGPAVTYRDGTQEWWLNDKLHREDGPAVIWADGTKQWYLNGQEYTERNFNEKIKLVV